MIHGPTTTTVEMPRPQATSYESGTTKLEHRSFQNLHRF